MNAADPTTKPRTIGVMGGTFDPIHLGHLIAAEAAREILVLDELRLVPAGCPPHRQSAPQASAADRLAMARLAVQDRAGILVDGRETEPGASPYMIDTLDAIAVENPGATVTLIVGQDWLDAIHTWRRGDEIMNRYQVAVLRRPVDSSEGAASQESGMQTLQTPAIDISSTDIRKRIQENRSIRFLVPESVENHIREKDLYQEDK